MADQGTSLSLTLTAAPAARESGVEGEESCYYHCVLCSYSTKAKLNLIQHDAAP